MGVMKVGSVSEGDVQAPDSTSWNAAARPYALAFFALIGSLALALAVKSLWHPIEHDTPLMLYPTHLAMTGQRVIYRDLYDYNFPASYLIYGLLGSLTGMNDVLIQLVDVLLFAALAVFSVKAFGERGRLYPLIAVAAYACYYFAVVTYFTLQREFFIVLCLMLATALMSKPDRKGLDLVLGLLAAFTFLIKPQAMIGFLWLAVIRWSDVKSLGRSALRAIGLQFLAFETLIAATIAYLASVGALKPLITVVINYLPLYAEMDGGHYTAPPEVRRQTLINKEMLADHRWWLLIVAVIAAAFLIRSGSTDAGQKRSLKLALGLTIAYWIYPLPSGAFFAYHWLPFNLCLFILTALCFQAASERAKFAKIAVGAAGLVAFAQVARYGATNLSQPILPANNGRVDALTDFLSARLHPGDTVQPLDLTGGAVHAMLRTNATIATPFLSDFHFYHHVSSPYIQSLRKTFIEDFDKANPRFVISCYGPDKPWPTGLDTSQHFPELTQRLVERYDIAYRGDNCYVFQRKGS